MSEESTLDPHRPLQAARDATRARDNRAALVERLNRTLRADGTVEPLPGLYFHRVSSPTEAVYGASGLVFCVIAQGRKEIWLGEQRYRYDPARYLLATVDLPVVGQIIEPSPARPYLSLSLKLQPALVSSVMLETGHLTPHNPAYVSAFDVSPLDNSLLDAVVRLVRLVDSPTEGRFMAPLITREIVYRLLMGEQGDRLRHVAVFGSRNDRIARAIERLRNDFTQPLRIESIARELGMSVSGLHHQFKAVTAMSPLQFQKRLRLQEARRLMLGERLNPATAAHRVGYDNASHFSREYKRLFGLPPARDVERLRGTVRPNVSAGATRSR